jgi:type IV pilus secretin PilQ/predicted competence protein
MAFLVVQVVIGASFPGEGVSASPVFLETIRGGQHPNYASIVFQFSGRVLAEAPVVRENAVFFRLKHVETDLVRFRQYKSFDSWVMLEQAGTDLNVQVGLPENFMRLSHFLMENPDRLVINLYEKKRPLPPAPQEAASGDSETPPAPHETASKPLALVVEQAPDPALAKEENAEENPRPSIVPTPKPIKKSSKVVEQITVDGLITLNFHQVDIRELLSALAIKREINIVMAQDVSGKVSLHLYGVTLDEALHAISLAGGFGYMKHGATHFIYKPKEERDPQTDRLKMRIFELKYAEVDKVQEVLDAIPGKRVIQFHEPSKTIIVEDIPENIKKIETIIRFWDRMPKQVMIEAKILEISLTDEMSLGVNWQKILGDARIGTGGFSIAVPPTAEGSSPVPSASGVFANMLTGAGTRHEFAIALDALQAKTKVNTLSTPKILAIHSKQARVQVGGQQGYKETTVTGTGLATESVQFLETGTILDITPYIGDKGNVLLNVKPSINSVTIDAATGIPTVQSTTVSTWLMAKSGETVFIGGLIQDQKTNTREMVPCLGNAPGLGWLFRGTSRSTGKNEVVVLITPQVFDEDRERLDQEALEKTNKVEEALKKPPPPPHQEFFYVPWE